MPVTFPASCTHHDKQTRREIQGLEGGEVLHYEVMNTMAQSLGNLQAGNTVQSILEEEKKHLMSCIQLVRQNASSSS